MNSVNKVRLPEQTNSVKYQPKSVVSYVLTAREPIHCGGNGRVGTHVPFRKMPIIVGRPKVLKSNFVSDAERIEALMYVVWALTNQPRAKDKLNTIGATRYDFYANVLSSSAGAKDRWQWLTRVCEKMDILSLSDQRIHENLIRFKDQEFFALIRSYMPMITLLLRYMKEQEKEANKKRSSEGSESHKKWTPTRTIYDGFEKMEIYNDTVNIPVIPANSLRGIMRRLLFAEFFTIMGMDNLASLTMDEHFKGEGLEGMPKFLYNMCFAGGALMSGAGEYEDIDFIQEMKRMIPPIELLGTAIGSGTIQGCFMPTSGRLKCLENGYEDFNSFYNYLDIQFFTRMDSSKQEARFNLSSTGKSKKTKAATQMKYEMEVVIPGSQFTGEFEVLKPHSPIAKATLVRGLELLSEYGHVGGSGAKGLGKVQWDFSFDFFGESDSKKYIDYLLDNKTDIMIYLVNLKGKFSK